MLYENFGGGEQREPIVYCCGRDENLTPGICYGPVVRDIFVAECCTGGYGSVIINGTEFALQAGDFFFLFPGDTVIHTASEREPREGFWCSFDGEAVAPALARAGITSKKPFAPPKTFRGMTAVLARIVGMQNESDPGAELRRAACIYELLGLLLEHQGGAHNPWIQRALGYMEMHYEEPLDVAAIARAAGLERSYFSTLFRTETGKSPHAYLSRIRIRKACVLLRSEGYTVADAAEAVGLDARNFARLFRREMGMTPHQFAKNS